MAPYLLRVQLPKVGEVQAKFVLVPLLAILHVEGVWVPSMKPKSYHALAGMQKEGLFWSKNLKNKEINK